MHKFILLIALFVAECAFALNIVEAEYFINTDPGLGNGVDITITPGDQISFSLLNIPTTGLLTNRTHYLYTRYRSEEGPWSLAQRQPFFLFSPLQNSYQAREITQLQYWFDNLTPVTVDIGDNDFINYAALIPTSGLAVNTSHKLSVRYIDNTGKISHTEARYFFLHEGITGAISIYNITHLEYRFDAQLPLFADVTDGTNINFADSITTAGLSLNTSHKLTVRYLDERGLWSNPEARYFFIHGSPGGGIAVEDITHVEYRFDANPPVLVDIVDAPSFIFQDTISTAGLSVNTSHKLTFRFLDEGGLYSPAEARYFFLHQAPNGVVQYFDISHVEVWFDTLAHTILDIADAMNINFADSIPHNLTAGPHHFRLRYRDERGYIGNTESRPFFVWTGAGPGGNARLAGAEWFIDSDPGVGNGTQISFPQDGAWDERNEMAIPILVGVPIGPHLFGIRFKDELNYWSIALIDSFIMGPVLTIRVDGSNIVLDWIANPTHTPFRIYRSNVTQGPFVEIAQTDSLTYTDANVVPGSAQKFYHITTTQDLPGALRRTETFQQSP